MAASDRVAQAERLADLRRMRRIHDRIDREFAQPLDLEMLAREEFISSGHLSRQFKATYGESPYSYLMTRRVERAMALLRRGDLSVTDICFEVGFSSLGTFSTRFKELVGRSPSAYREAVEAGEMDLPSCIVKAVARPIRNQEASPSRQP
jgi:AraC-like DNA-binding protein